MSWFGFKTDEEKATDELIKLRLNILGEIDVIGKYIKQELPNETTLINVMVQNKFEKKVSFNESTNDYPLKIYKDLNNKLDKQFLGDSKTQLTKWINDYNKKLEYFRSKYPKNSELHKMIMGELEEEIMILKKELLSIDRLNDSIKNEVRRCKNVTNFTQIDAPFNIKINEWNTKLSEWKKNSETLTPVQNTGLAKKIADKSTQSYAVRHENPDFCINPQQDDGYTATAGRVILNGGGQKRIVYKKGGKGEEYVKVGGEFVNLKRNYTKKH